MSVNQRFFNTTRKHYIDVKRTSEDWFEDREALLCYLNLCQGDTIVLGFENDSLWGYEHFKLYEYDFFKQKEHAEYLMRVKLDITINDKELGKAYDKGYKDGINNKPC